MPDIPKLKSNDADALVDAPFGFLIEISNIAVPLSLSELYWMYGPMFGMDKVSTYPAVLKNLRLALYSCCPNLALNPHGYKSVSCKL